MSIYENGTFKAVCKDYGVTIVEGREPFLWFVFSVLFPQGMQDMTFRSYLHTEKASEFTFRVLNALGYKGSNLDDLITGFESESIPAGREVNVVVEQSPPDDKGKQYFNIKYVNAIGGGGSSVKRADPKDAKAALAKLGSQAAFKKFRAVNPLPKVEDGDDPF